MNKYYLGLSGILLALFLFLSFFNNELGLLEKYLNEYGFTMYKPPRSNRGPGWVFRFVKTMDDRIVPATVCENLFPETKTIDGDLTIPNKELQESVDVDFAIDLLGSTIKNPTKAAVALKNVKDVTISWGKVISKELHPSNKIGKEGQIKKIDRKCYQRLNNLHESGELTGLFVVQEAMLVETFFYKFNVENKFSSELKGQYKNLLGLSTHGRVRIASNTELEIENPTYVGFIAVPIEEWHKTGDRTAVTASVKTGQPISVSKIADLLR